MPRRPPPPAPGPADRESPRAGPEPPAGRRLAVGRRRPDRATARLLGLALALGVLGALEQDPIRHALAGDPAGRLVVRSERFGRRQWPSQWRLRIAPDPARGATVHLWVGAELLDGVRLVRMHPAPRTAWRHDDRLEFAVPAPGGGEPLELTIDYQPRIGGPIAGRIGLEGGPALAVRQWVGP